MPLSISAVFSPPGDVSPHIRQIQEDLPQEQEDNRQDPENKKRALKAVSRRIREEFENGRHYHALDGRSIPPPRERQHRPDAAALAWHNDYRFKG